MCVCVCVCVCVCPCVGQIDTKYMPYQKHTVTHLRISKEVLNFVELVMSNVSPTGFVRDKKQASLLVFCLRRSR